MLYIVLLIAGLALITLPGLWAKRTLNRYSAPRQDLTLTGEQLALDLLQKFKLHHVTIEAAEPQQDHYDPATKTVRLSPDNLHNNSLTAITVAAHEVGHALQDATQFPGFNLRIRLAVVAHHFNKIGGWVLLLTPVVMAISRSPTVGLITGLIAVSSFFMSAAVHLITLPVEIDASFSRALPILKDCHYLKEQDLKAARRILKACAMTYIAQALIELLSFKRRLGRR